MPWIRLIACFDLRVDEEELEECSLDLVILAHFRLSCQEPKGGAGYQEARQGICTVDRKCLVPSN